MTLAIVTIVVSLSKDAITRIKHKRRYTTTDAISKIIVISITTLIAIYAIPIGVELFVFVLNS